MHHSKREKNRGISILKLSRKDENDIVAQCATFSERDSKFNRPKAAHWNVAWRA